jgi:hypothetical protein
MSKCIRCGGETHQRICPFCLSNWCDMRSAIFNKLQEKYGKLNPDNHQFFIKQTKKLESIWRKDKEKFLNELDNI